MTNRDSTVQPVLFGDIGISASAAERLDSLMAGETLKYSPCTRRSKNLIKRQFKEITQSQFAIMVETTWYNSSVHKNTYLIA